MTNNSNTDVKNAAKHYRDVLGFNVIPLRAGTKSSAIKWKEFQERKPTSQEFENFQFKNAGIVTGKTSGIAVVDVDDPDRFEEWLEEQGLELPDTTTAKTARRGFHYYYRIPDDVEVRGKEIVKDVVELKGDGNYVVAPPSCITKTYVDDGLKHTDSLPYEWLASPDEVEIADIPDWLLKVPEKHSDGPTVSLEATIPDGQRNSTLFSRARSLFRQGYDDNEVFALLETLNHNRCNPPLEQSELLSVVVSASKYIRGELYVSNKDEGVGVLMSEIRAEKVEWLWKGRIPLGKLTILDGDPGLGKSVITMDLAARVTKGWRFPDGEVDHVGKLDHLGHVDHLGGVVILSAEDGLADTIRPRLDAAGADTRKIVAISTVPDREGNERTIAIPEDITTIEKAIQRVDAKLIVVDPLMAFLSGKANYDQDVRKALTPLARMAERTGVAVLVVRHLNKQQGGKALYRGGSSIGIIGAARSGLVVEQHPDDEDLRVLAVNKSNLAEKSESLTYSIATAENDAAKVQWGKTTNLNADDILNPDTSEVGKAKEWLDTKLRDMPLPATTVFNDAEEAGIAKKTLYRAKDALGVESKKDGLGNTWRWHLVEDGQGSQGGQDFQDSREVIGLAS